VTMARIWCELRFNKRGVSYWCKSYEGWEDIAEVVAEKDRTTWVCHHCNIAGDTQEKPDAKFCSHTRLMLAFVDSFRDEIRPRLHVFNDKLTVRFEFESPIIEWRWY